MTSLSEVVRRQFAPMLSMLRDVIDTCPDEIWLEPELGVREHLYHTLVGMDIWLSPDPALYPFDQIVEDDAAELRSPATAAISRGFLLDYLDRVEMRVADLPMPDAAYLTPHLLRDSEFTLLDRCLGQFRHTQHHVGLINEKLAARGAAAVDWRGYGEG
jgi:hypothetical protein